MKRFYREVAILPDEAGHRILLGGRPVRTPAKQILSVPTVRLANFLAEEWRQQADTIRPETMPLTRLANTALDRMPAAREAMVEEMVGHGATDLVCYRADAPPELVERQDSAWQPVLEWIAATHDVRLSVTRSILPAAQPGEALDRLREVVEQEDDWRLIGLHAATTTLGSLVLGLALAAGRLEAEAAASASLLDELFEMERWGQEKDALDRHRVLRREVHAAKRFLDGLTCDVAGRTP
jgi:chaperone required for assembly of F1-ATPase